MRNLWASFNFLVHFLIIFFNVQSFKYEFLWKILDIQLYNIVRHWFSTKNWIFAIFFKKVSIDCFSHFSSKIHLKFSKNRLFHLPQFIIFLWSEFYARSNNQTIRIIGLKLRNLWASFNFLVHFLIIFFNVQSFKYEFLWKILDIQLNNIVRHWFSTKNWIFTIFFKKVSIDGFSHFSSKIHPKFQKIDFSIYPNILYICDFYARSKYEFLWKILDIQLYNIVRHWFSTKNWIFAIFFKKVSIDGFSHFSSKIHPKFSKNRLFHIPQYIIFLWSEFYARSNNQTIRIIG